MQQPPHSLPPDVDPYPPVQLPPPPAPIPRTSSGVMEFGLAPPGESRGGGRGPTRGLALKAVGAVMMAFGVLFVLAFVVRLVHPPADGAPTTPLPIAAFVCLLGVACMTGGNILWRLAGTPGESRRKWVAGTPGIIAVVLLAAGITAAALPSPEQPTTDEFGYTQVERDAFVAGCGGSARCACFFDAIERSLTPQEFVAAERQYGRTGTMPSAIADAVAGSGC